jgi:hypothetical protein
MEEIMLHDPERFPRVDSRSPADLRVPVRNRYFYGKLLDVRQLEMEQQYFNDKRWLLNRLVIGPGVVCGLRVVLTDDLGSVIVKPGLAIDRCGREIVVGDSSRSVRLPPRDEYSADARVMGPQTPLQGKQSLEQRERRRHYYCNIPYAHVVLCYHECDSDPAPAMAGGCNEEAMCSPGSIREQYRVRVRRGFAMRPKPFPEDIVEDGEIVYDRLVDYVSSSCRGISDDCCLPLANIELRENDDGWRPEVDNSVRPIVYTNRLLFQLIDSLARGDEDEEEYT